MSNFLTTGPVGAELFDAAKRTDSRHDETNSDFSQFCEGAPELKGTWEKRSKSQWFL
jgi:hypothetical protein